MLKFYEEIEKDLTYECYHAFDKSHTCISQVPKRYFINPYGILYNSMGENAHKDANLIYTIEYLRRYIIGRTEEDMKYMYLERGNPFYRIDDKEFFYSELCKRKRDYSYLYDGFFRGVYEDLAFRYLHERVTEPTETLKMILRGIISSHIVLFKQFEQLKENPERKEILERIYKRTKGDIADILVRFCGFHKIESQSAKFITTSSKNYEDFMEYFKRGYSVNVIPSLVSVDESVYYTAATNFLEKTPEYTKQLTII